MLRGNNSFSDLSPSCLTKCYKFTYPNYQIEFYKMIVVLVF